jgi:diguanylate cyclase (GGDEF)-like protein
MTTDSEIDALVTTDPLTSLANRRGIIQRLEEIIATQVRHGGTTFVAFIDLDGFKAINDTLSHAHGDLALRTIAQRLKSAMRPEDIVGRLGGDEYMVIGRFLDGHDIDAVRHIGDRIQTITDEEINLDGIKIKLGASIGIVEYTAKESIPAEDLINWADKAMYDIKKNGKNGYKTKRLT